MPTAAVEAFKKVRRFMGGFFEMPGILASKILPDLRDWKGWPSHFASKRATFDFTRFTALSSEPLVSVENGSHLAIPGPW